MKKRNKNKYIIVNSFRFTVFILTLIVLSNLLFNLFLKSNISYGYDDKEIIEEYENFYTIEVKEGDNLWNIANKYNNDSDIREYVSVIRELNNLYQPIIHPGQDLIIPY